MDTIRSKIIINIFILLITIIGIVGMEYNEFRHLVKIRDVGARRSADAVTAQIGARIGLSLYAVTADAVFKHDLDASVKKWAETKERNLKRLDDVINIADTKEEKEWAETARKAVQEIITIFESRTLPLLKTSDGITKEIKYLDDAIGTQIMIVRATMLKINESIAMEAKTADEEFNREIKRAIIKALIVGLIGILLQAGLATWLMRTILEKDAERKQAEEKVRSSEESFKALAEASFGGIIIHDKGYILECNKELSTITGFNYEEHIGMNGLELIAPESLNMVLANIQSGYDKSYEVIGVRKDGSKYPLVIRGKNVTYKGREARVIEFRDITDRKRAEEERLSLEKQLLHAQKLESLGVLAGGIAHDFNNILMAIMGNADLALMRINKESPAVENLQRIEQASARAADLAKQMLAYSGKGKFVIENINLNILLEEMLHMLNVSISKKAVLRLNPHQHLPTVEADATQMRQILMNLVINASEAIGDKSGVISITTGCMDCDRNYLKDIWLDENISEGLYVYLEIADSGCGMDKETMTKLFDPFFTTKFTGRGLGMAAVLGIVRGHKGAIKIYSEPNRGTTFKILLPASNRPAEIFNGASRHDSWKGEGKVLLVDDEETVRGIGTEMLKELGFTVITADDGREGLEQFKQNSDISLVILDLTMPHMDGEQCFRELRQLKPDVKVIMSSGYNEQEVTQKFVGKGLAGFIQKPYKLSVLEEAIRKIV